MAQKEYREFYIRTNKQPTGNRADQELDFPIEGIVNTCNGKELKYNRLLSDHYATDDVIIKFLESIGFKLNPEDTASGTEQGFVIIATDSNAINNVIETGDFKSALQVHQLPKHLMFDGVTSLTLKYKDLVTGIVHTLIADAVATGNPFCGVYINPRYNKLLYSVANLTPIVYNNSPSSYLQHSVIPISVTEHLVNNGDKIIYNVHMTLSGSISSDTHVEIYLNDPVGATSIWIGGDTIVTGANDGNYTFNLEIIKINGTNVLVKSTIVKDSSGTVDSEAVVTSIKAIPLNDFTIGTITYTGNVATTVSLLDVTCENKILQ